MTFRCPGEGFGHHFGKLLVTLGSLFLDFEGTGKGLDFDGFWLPWGARSRESSKIWGRSALTSLLAYWYT